MGRKIDMDKLMAKIAAVTNTDEEKLKEASKKATLYSYDEQMMESQSVINFYKARIEPKPPIQRSGESNLDFATRKIEYERAFNEWRIRVCEGCGLDFAYAFHYEGVKFCSLDCLDSELRKIGLQVTRGRDLML